MCWKGTGPGDRRPMLKFKVPLLKIGSVTLGNLLSSYEEAAGQAKPWGQPCCTLFHAGNACEDT